MIKPADKGSATVIMSKDDYLTKVMSHLNVANFYEKLNDDPTECYSEEITPFLVDFNNREIIDKDAFNYLRPKQTRTSWFYILPKLHKLGIPGRPIVSSCEAPTEKYHCLLTTIYVRW